MVSEAELGTKDHKIEKFVLQFKGLSNEQLWREIEKYGNDAPVPERIAASRLLKQRAEIKTAENHAELLTEIRRPHWSISPLFWVSVVAMVAACIAAYPVLFPPPASKLESPVQQKQNAPVKSQQQSVPLPTAPLTTNKK